ncbi:MAG: hypothetical protein AAFR36_12995, partial [Bacteroidota bacterium]
GRINYDEYILHRTRVANGIIQIKNTVFQKLEISGHITHDFTKLEGVSKQQSSVRAEVHMLIEPGDDFNDLLRQMIYVHNDISVKSDFFVEKSQRFENYKKGLDDFLADKNVKWLLTVYPEEYRCRLNKRQEKELLEKLLLSGKRMICFESGFKLREHELNRDNSVIVIGTNHRQASQYLISHLAKNFLQKNLNVHIVSIAGPVGHSAADVRRAVNSEFFARLILNLRKNFGYLFSDEDHQEFWDSIIRLIGNIKELRFTLTELSSWRGEEADEIIDKWFTDSQLFSGYHTCFICADDNTAMVVRDAIENRTNKKLNELNVSLYGFDGISDMIEYLNTNKVGATMKVQLSEFCAVAAELIREYENDSKVIYQNEILIPSVIYPEY